MKKILVIAAIIIVGGIGAAVLFTGKDDKTGNNENTSVTTPSESKYGAKDACNILTEALANKSLGDGAEKGTTPPPPASGDVHTSSCTYTSATDGNLRAVTLLVRSPLSEIGEQSNQMPFENRGADTQEVNGYQKAYWDPEMGQLNILHDGTWYIFSVGKANPGERTLDEARAVADQLYLNTNLR